MKTFIRFNIPDLCFRDYIIFWYLFLSPSKNSLEGKINHLIKTKIDAQYIYYFASARQALVHIIETVTKPQETICVPEYVCPSVITAIKYSKRKVFYAACANNSLEFDYDDLKTNFQNEKFDWIVACNSHGHLQDIENIFEITDKVIVDDAYEGLILSEHKKTTRNAPVIWSTNFKTFCGPGGGILISNSPVSENVYKRLQEIPIWYTIVPALLLLLRGCIGNLLPSGFKGGEEPKLTTKTEMRKSWERVPSGKMNKIQMIFLYNQLLRFGQMQKKLIKNNVRIKQIIKKNQFLKLAEGDNATIFPRQIPVQVNKETVSDEIILNFRMQLHQSGIQSDFPYPSWGNPSNLSSQHRKHLHNKFFLIPCGSHLYERQLSQIEKALENLTVENI